MTHSVGLDCDRISIVVHLLVKCTMARHLPNGHTHRRSHHTLNQRKTNKKINFQFNGFLFFRQNLFPNFPFYCIANGWQT